MGLYDTSLTIRGIREFEKMFGREIFSSLRVGNLSDKTSEEFGSMFCQAKRNIAMEAVQHWGEGRWNPSTIACMLHKIEEKMIEMFPDFFYKELSCKEFSFKEHLEFLS